MAIQIMTQVWKCGPRDIYPMVILLALADHADECGECYPSIALLQEKGRMSKSSVLRVLKMLTDEGWLTVRHRSVEAEDGRARGNLYCVNMERLGLADPGRKRVRRPPLEANKRAPRGVTQTPRENTVRCQTEPREVSVVKSPPAPPLVGEPSGTVTTPPNPPLARGAFDRDDEAHLLEAIAEQRRIAKGPNLGDRVAARSELLQLQAELLALRKRRAVSEGPPRPGDQAAKPSPPAGSLEELTAWLMRKCGFVETGRREPVLVPALRGVIAMVPGAELQRVAEMAEAWSAYARGPSLWGPKKFFAEGHWQRPASWPSDGRLFDPCAPGRRAMA